MLIQLHSKTITNQPLNSNPQDQIVVQTAWALSWFSTPLILQETQAGNLNLKWIFQFPYICRWKGSNFSICSIFPSLANSWGPKEVTVRWWLVIVTHSVWVGRRKNSTIFLDNKWYKESKFWSKRRITLFLSHKFNKITEISRFIGNTLEKVIPHINILIIHCFNKLYFLNPLYVNNVIQVYSIVSTWQTISIWQKCARNYDKNG